MSTLDTAGIGYTHNRLAQTATQLETDGHHTLAAEYEQRATVEQQIYTSMLDLIRQAKHLVKRDGEQVDARTGAELAAWLLRHGWTPPAHLNGRIEE